MAARPSAPARRARLDGPLTDWFLAEWDVSEEGKKKRSGGERDEVRRLGLMMKFQLRGTRERRASQLNRADKEEMI